MTVPGPKSSALMALREKYVAKGPYNITSVFIEEAKGALVKDVDGNSYIDFAGGIGVQNAGHCPEEVVEALKAQIEKFIHPCFHVMQYESYVKLAQALAEVTPGDFVKKSMFVNSGAEAVENAVKMSRKYTGRSGIVSFDCGYHGRTLMTMSLTSKVKPYKFGYGPFAPETYKIPYAYCYRCQFGQTYPNCELQCAQQVERFFLSEAAPETVAAIIAEPVQGEGGFIVPPPEFIPAIKKICEKYGIVFIADEIQTGFGRTGKLFAMENWGVAPDLMTMSKSISAGVPLSAVTGKAEIVDAPGAGEIGGTFAGSPLGCTAALKVLEIIQRDKLAQRAQVMGVKMLDRFRAMQEKYPIIGDVRGLCAMVGMELVKDSKTKEPAKEETSRINNLSWHKGAITLTAGIYGNVIRLLPPLVMTDEQLERGLDILEQCFAEVCK